MSLCQAASSVTIREHNPQAFFVVHRGIEPLFED